VVEIIEVHVFPVLLSRKENCSSELHFTSIIRTNYQKGITPVKPLVTITYSTIFPLHENFNQQTCHPPENL